MLEDATESSPAAALQGVMGGCSGQPQKNVCAEVGGKQVGQQQADTQKCLAY